MQWGGGGGGAQTPNVPTGVNVPITSAYLYNQFHLITYDVALETTVGDFKCGVGVGVIVGEPENASEPSSTPAVGLGKRYRL